MDTLADIIIIAGLGSLGATWVFIVVMLLKIAWNTGGHRVLSFIQKLKGKL